MMWHGSCCHAGLSDLSYPTIVHLAAATIDDLLTKGPKEVIGSTLTVRLLGSGSFGGPLDDDSDWAIGAAPVEGSGWLSLDWTLSQSYGSQRCLRCLLRARMTAGGATSLEVLLPSETSGFAPRPATPLATKTGMRVLRKSGFLLCLERAALTPLNAQRKAVLGTSMQRAVCGLFDATFKVFQAALQSTNQGKSSSTSRGGGEGGGGGGGASRQEVHDGEVAAMDKEAREKYGATIFDLDGFDAAPADTLCVRLWHLKAERKLPADALWTVIRFRVLLHKLFKEWPLLRTCQRKQQQETGVGGVGGDGGTPSLLSSNMSWLGDFLLQEEEDSLEGGGRRECLAGDAFEAFMARLHGLGFSTCFVRASDYARGGVPVAALTTPPTPATTLSSRVSGVADTSYFVPPVLAYSLSVGLDSLPRLRLEHFSQHCHLQQQQQQQQQYPCRQQTCGSGMSGGEGVGESLPAVSSSPAQAAVESAPVQRGDTETATTGTATSMLGGGCSSSSSSSSSGGAGQLYSRNRHRMAAYLAWQCHRAKYSQAGARPFTKHKNGDAAVNQDNDRVEVGAGNGSGDGNKEEEGGGSGSKKKTTASNDGVEVAMVRTARLAFISNSKRSGKLETDDKEAQAKKNVGVLVATASAPQREREEKAGASAEEKLAQQCESRRYNQIRVAVKWLGTLPVGRSGTKQLGSGVTNAASSDSSNRNSFVSLIGDGSSDSVNSLAAGRRTRDRVVPALRARHFVWLEVGCGIKDRAEDHVTAAASTVRRVVTVENKPMRITKVAAAAAAAAVATTRAKTDEWILDARGKRFWGQQLQWRADRLSGGGCARRGGGGAGGGGGGVIGCTTTAMSASKVATWPLARLHPHPDSVAVGQGATTIDTDAAAQGASKSPRKSQAGGSGDSGVCGNCTDPPGGQGQDDEAALEVEMRALLRGLAQEHNRSTRSRWDGDTNDKDMAIPSSGLEEDKAAVLLASMEAQRRIRSKRAQRFLRIAVPGKL